MKATQLKAAELDAQNLAQIQALEDELGAYVVALKPESPYAPLSAEQVQRLQRLEQQLGVVLLAYRRQEDSVGA